MALSTIKEAQESDQFTQQFFFVFFQSDKCDESIKKFEVNALFYSVVSRVVLS